MRSDAPCALIVGDGRALRAWCTISALPCYPYLPMNRRIAVLALALTLTSETTAQTPARTLLRAGRLLVGPTDSVRLDQGVLIENGRIVRIGPFTEVAAAAGQVVTTDLRRFTVLPGLIDAHTHLFLNGEPYATQVLEHSIPYRTIEATMAARAALSFGFTTIRDLETEGAMYADVDIKVAIERGIIPGPRMLVATRASRRPGCTRSLDTPGSSPCLPARSSSMEPITCGVPCANRSASAPTGSSCMPTAIRM
jgi:hypothetical protein